MPAYIIASFLNFVKVEFYDNCHHDLNSLNIYVK